MIELITGLPGNGKTLYLIASLQERAKREGRPVYYNGVPLTEEGKQKLGWIELADPTKWAECPPDSIIVIDEAQRTFRNRSIQKEAPKFVTDLETHRHGGVDIILVTQLPKLLDPAARGFANKHFHCVRKWGMEASTIHEWSEVNENCGKASGRKSSIKHHWKFDKSVYGLYKSAEVHTVKRNIPWRVKLLLVLPLLLGGLVYMAYNSFKAKMNAEPSKPGQSVQVAPGAAPPAGPPGGSSTRASYTDAVADARQYVYVNTPRVQGMPHTAPKYDELTKPVAVPMPAACVYNGKRCQCYSQQGTRMETPLNQCLDIAHNGYFEEFDKDGLRDKRTASTAALDREDGHLPLSKADTSQRPYVTSFGTEDGFGVLGKRGPGDAKSAL